MTTVMNRQVILIARPEGIPDASHFDIRKSSIPRVQDGEVLIRNAILSVDPAMRGWVSNVANYSEPVVIGSVMRAIAIGRVIESKNPHYREDEWVCGLFGWQDYALSDGSSIWFKHTHEDIPISASLGILGVNGITAYHGLLDIGRPAEGNTVAVSTAAGAVGSTVGQIAKIKGCRTVGITSSEEKIALCRDVYRFDAAISYKHGDLQAEIEAACPDGVDVYFDNTAGAISDAVYRCLNIAARCIVCGTAAHASWDPWPEGPRLERHLLVKRASIKGMLVFDYVDRFEEARTALADWLRKGELTYREDVLEGIEAAPDSILHLYSSKNLGKLLIKIDDY